MSKNSKYTFLIVCEGEVTEPLFFKSIRDLIITKNNSLNPHFIEELHIAPEPREDPPITTAPVKHKRKRKSRTTKPVLTIDTIPIEDGPPPVRWVQTAIREAKTKAYNEIWVVFDRDNHPQLQQAFNLVKQPISGIQIRIAFSSRSFEQYLLMHFEKSNTVFLKTNCKHKKPKSKKEISSECGMGTYPNYDCQGKVCINGYAATKAYWANSKQDNSKKENTFKLIESKLEIGYQNVSWLRHQSVNPSIPIYKQNPYTDVDLLVKRLMEHDLNYQWIKADVSSRCNNTWKVLYDAKKQSISLTNISKVTLIVPAAIVTLYSVNTEVHLGERSSLFPNKALQIDLQRHLSGVDYFKISLKDQKHILLCELQ